ncbi:hypothetical protein MTP99_017925 [Tenebrio molitor]|nr:hypothetical protein MTP99_017925 [Tenebrio molitor]
MSLNFSQQVEKVRKEAYKIFNKDEQSAKKDVEMVKEWLRTQHHLPEIMNDNMILNFLMMNKFSIERTKQKIDMYYTIKDVIPDVYCNPKSPQIKDFMKDVYICLHPVLVKGLYKVYWYKVKEPNKLSVRKMIMVGNNIAEIRLNEDCFYRDFMIVDLDNVGFSDIVKTTPTDIGKFVTIYEKIFSFCLEALYIVNAPSFTSNVMAIFKSLMKPKIFNRIQVHQDTEVLKELFSDEDLPRDYGGKGPTLQELNDLIMQKFEEYGDRFDQLDKLRVDENLRPEKLNNDEVLGFHGNFKKLDVD